MAKTEGHINRLKTLKRAMYGRAGAELLRARMLALSSPDSARKVRQTQLNGYFQLKWLSVKH